MAFALRSHHFNPPRDCAEFVLNSNPDYPSAVKASMPSKFGALPPWTRGPLSDNTSLKFHSRRDRSTDEEAVRVRPC